MMEDKDMPCGGCDMGVYSELSMLNRKAREFSVLTQDQREENMPRCKKYNRACVGAKHFSDAIQQIDDHLSPTEITAPDPVRGFVFS